MEGTLKNQVIPVSLTIVVGAVLTGLLYVLILVLNHFTATDIIIHIKPVDIAIGLTVYLKTSIDFAIFIGNLMSENNTWKSRIAIEIGTAFGNAAGTFLVLIIWTFFKEVTWLLALMIFVAALVLFRLAQDSLDHAKTDDNKYPQWFQTIVLVFDKFLVTVNKAIAPVLNKVVPNVSMKSKGKMAFWPLFTFAFGIPFILGLDDFAGYVPLFNVVNVFGFAIGVIVGHMLLNMFLYLSPSKTIKAVKNPIIALIGSAAFVGLGIWGLIEVVKLFTHH